MENALDKSKATARENWDIADAWRPGRAAAAIALRDCAEVEVNLRAPEYHVFGLPCDRPLTAPMATLLVTVGAPLRDRSASDHALGAQHRDLIRAVAELL